MIVTDINDSSTDTLRRMFQAMSDRIDAQEEEIQLLRASQDSIKRTLRDLHSADESRVYGRVTVGPILPGVARQRRWWEVWK